MVNLGTGLKTKVGVDGLFRATGKAITAASTPGTVELDFDFRGDALRITAPTTIQGAAFEEDHCPYAGAVMQGVNLDIGNCAVNLGFLVSVGGCVESAVSESLKSGYSFPLFSKDAK